MNIKDIASMAGCSTATVSRVINNQPGVKSDIKEKIERIITENDYRPNLIARGLVRKKSNTIGVMIPQVNSFYTGRIEGVYETAAKKGYSVMLGSRIMTSANELESFKMLFESQVEGIIYFASRIREEVAAELRRMSKTIPIILVDQEAEDLDIPCIVQDNYAGAVKIMEYLIGKGHTKIGFIKGYYGDKAVKLRYKAYEDILSKYNIPLNEAYIYEGNFSPASGYSGAEKMMQNKDRPTAIFAANDSMAIGAVNYLVSAGFSIPDEIAVAGYDDIELAEYISPSLTTVRQDHKGTGIEAAEMLFAILENGRARTKKVIMNHEVIIRKST